MIILYDYTRQGDPECFRSYLPKLQRDVNKKIWMPNDLRWYDVYGEDKYEAYVNNAINMSRHQNLIVLLPAISSVCDILKDNDELKDCYLLAQPDNLLSNEFCERFKGYAIDFAYYDKFAKHIKEFIRKENDFWKWFRFDQHIF